MGCSDRYDFCGVCYADSHSGPCDPNRFKLESDAQLSRLRLSHATDHLRSCKGCKLCKALKTWASKKVPEPKCKYCNDDGYIAYPYSTAPCPKGCKRKSVW